MNATPDREPRRYYKQLLFRLLTFFLVLAILPIAAFGYLAIDQITDLGAESGTQTDRLGEEIYEQNAAVLREEAIDELQAYVIEKSGEWDLFFAQMVDLTTMIRDYASDLFATGAAPGP